MTASPAASVMDAAAFRARLVRFPTVVSMSSSAELPRDRVVFGIVLSSMLDMSAAQTTQPVAHVQVGGHVRYSTDCTHDAYSQGLCRATVRDAVIVSPAFDTEKAGTERSRTMDVVGFASADHACGLVVATIAV